MWVTTYKFVCWKSIIQIRILLASSRVSSRLPPNKALSLMLQIDTCKLLHTNSYVINQSYEFVFHLTSSLQPPNKKVRTFGKWCWWRSQSIIRIRILLASSCVSSRLPPNKAPSLMLRIETYELLHTNLYVINQLYEFVATKLYMWVTTYEVVYVQSIIWICIT